MITYTCTKCHQTKDRSEFPPDKRRPKGVQSVCRECRRLDEQKRREQRKLANAAPLASKTCPKCGETKIADEFYRNVRMSGGLTPYCKDCIRKDRREAGQAGQYKKNREYLKGSEAEKRYWNSDKGKLNRKRQNARRRAQLKKSQHTLTVEDWNEVLRKQNFECNHCHKPFSQDLPPTVDHVLPVSLGGGTTKENVQALCSECNSRKGNRWIG